MAALKLKTVWYGPELRLVQLIDFTENPMGEVVDEHFMDDDMEYDACNPPCPHHRDFCCELLPKWFEFSVADAGPAMALMHALRLYIDYQQEEGACLPLQGTWPKKHNIDF